MGKILPVRHKMSDGTSLEDLERGQIENTADAARMREILQDIDAPSASSAPHGSIPSLPQGAGPMRMAPPMPPTLHMPSMYNPNIPPQYVPIADEDDEKRPSKRKGNIWSTILDRIQDPIVIFLLIFALSFPALHTQVAKYASWAYGVGGQLSWLGLAVISFLGAIIFALYRGVRDLLA